MRRIRIIWNFFIWAYGSFKSGPVFDHQRVIKKSEMTEINPSLIIEMLKEESFDKKKLKIGLITYRGNPLQEVKVFT